MKLMLIFTLLTSGLNAFSATQISEACEAKLINSAQKIMSNAGEITEIETMRENQFVITYDRKDSCYGSIYAEIVPGSCEIVSMEEPYWPRCN
jgi:hypothetical protein